VTAQEETKQTGKIKSVRRRKIMERPSAPSINVGSSKNNKVSKLNRNWKPTMDWLKARQLRTPRNNAAREMSRHQTRISSSSASGSTSATIKPIKRTKIIIASKELKRFILFSASAVNS
jgi:hypothetical protein